MGTTTHTRHQIAHSPHPDRGNLQTTISIGDLHLSLESSIPNDLWPLNLRVRLQTTSK